MLGARTATISIIVPDGWLLFMLLFVTLVMRCSHSLSALRFFVPGHVDGLLLPPLTHTEYISFFKQLAAALSRLPSDKTLPV